uniref:SAM domain-containing protein n=1 Tax=Ciona savignyi TaxID=51511 RepID=H2YCU8_CIOSA
KVMFIHDWGCSEVEQWLISEGFEKYSDLICNEHEVDGEVLLSLNENDLRKPPLQLTKLSDIKKLWRSLKLLQQKSKIECSALKGAFYSLPFTGPATHKNGMYNNSNNNHGKTIDYDSDNLMLDSDMEEPIILRNKGVNFLPELNKLFVSFMYATFVSWVTAYMMVLVHERVPDKQKYPPLPDIFLDNVPLIPYAFQLAEFCGLFLATMWLLILIFHKHRWRYCIYIFSNINLMISPRLISVDNISKVQASMYNSSWERLVRATEIMVGCGMTLTGVHTCGDYMFSGHTAYLTLFNHLITEYTPTKFYRLHTLSWVLNLFGIFFVLAAHEHYSIDVVIAFYITSRIFLYYHMLANTRCYWHSKRVKIWFPLLSYFECNVPGKVPNEYEWPIQLKNLRKRFTL